MWKKHQQKDTFLCSDEVYYTEKYEQLFDAEGRLLYKELYEKRHHYVYDKKDRVALLMIGIGPDGSWDR